MRFPLLRSIILTAALAASAFAQPAQPAAEKVSLAGRMFAGETLKYDGKLNKIINGISVAELTFTATSAPDSNDLLVKSEATSKGTLLKLFRFSFLQQYESTVDLSTFKILKTTKHDVQKDRVRDSEAIFDYKQKRVIYVETDPKDRNRPPRRIASEIGDHLTDMVSAIYSLRLQPLSVGKRFDITVSDSGLVYRVPVVVTGREMQKTILGKVSCFRVEPEVFGKDRLIEKDGKMVIWMTEDARHVPVRAQINTEFGKIDIKLRTATNPN
ncbi:hypothetical protein BH10ACI2_BH10ACI2_09220 [soil metagenome]